ncbi:hypothetical protein J2Z44_003349 [Clostridium punense]|uniref:PH domain-containing protein n=1 Tax=Clostridium punense TaxID=1054297 RepID=A0ABS4K6U9_9CLOT|nr:MULTISPECIES: hypothetical protein [Clostridium]EQB88354.1 hypothetical protein M918_04810 [Clostridium sp. BL8]MBP2023512.1 hypothetical protein [Clostridium punense]
MIYRSKLTIMITLLLGILTLLYFSMQFKMLEYKIFGIIGVVISSIMYIINIFEYYVIDGEKIIYISRLKHKREIVHWKDVNRLISCSDRFVSAIIIEYGTLGGKNIIINSWIKGYSKIIDIAIQKTKCNKDIVVDSNLYNYIK